MGRTAGVCILTLVIVSSVLCCGGLFKACTSAAMGADFTVVDAGEPQSWVMAKSGNIELIAYAFDGQHLRAELVNHGTVDVDRVWLVLQGLARPSADASPRQWRLLPNAHSQLLAAHTRFAFQSWLYDVTWPLDANTGFQLRIVEVPASPSTHHIVARKNWDAHPRYPRGVTRYPSVSQRYLKWIVIHHTGFWDAPGPAAVRALHVDDYSWADVGYHFVIGEDGVIFEGRALSFMGAHAGQSVESNRGVWRARHPRPRAPADAGYTKDSGEWSVQDIQALVDQARRFDPDYGSIGIAVDGDFSLDDTPTRAQQDALRWLLQDLQRRFRIVHEHIITHREVETRLVEDRGLTFTGKYTECPGEGLQQYVDELRAEWQQKM